MYHLHSLGGNQGKCQVKYVGQMKRGLQQKLKGTQVGLFRTKKLGLTDPKGKGVLSPLARGRRPKHWHKPQKGVCTQQGETENRSGKKLSKPQTERTAGGAKASPSDEKTIKPRGRVRRPHHGDGVGNEKGDV